MPTCLLKYVYYVGYIFNYLLWSIMSFIQSRNYSPINQSSLNSYRSFREDDNESIIDAAEKGDLKLIQRLLKRGDYIDATDRGGETALHKACKCGQTELVELLIQYGADVNLKSPLLKAVKAENRDIILLLVNAGAKLRAEEKKLYDFYLSESEYANSILAYAARYSDKDTFEQVLELDPFEKYASEQVTRLFVDCCKDVEKIKILVKTDFHPEKLDAIKSILSRECFWKADFNTEEEKVTILNLLIDAGADVNARGDGVHFLKKTTLHWALENGGSKKIIQFLLEKGADVNAQSENGSAYGYPHGALQDAIEGRATNEVIAMLIESGADLHPEKDSTNRRDELFYMALGKYRNSNADVLVTLVKNGAITNGVNANENKSLWKRVFKAGVSIEVIMAMLNAGIAIDAPEREEALFTAIDSNCSEKIIQALIGDEKDVDFLNSLLEYSVPKMKNIEVARILIKKGANVNFRDDRGNSLLHKLLDVSNYYWRRSDSLSALAWIKMLLEAGHPINARNSYGETVLMQLLKKEDDRGCFQLLLDSGANPNIPNQSGDLPLHRAVGRKSADLAIALIKHGVDVNVLNRDKKSPLVLAARKGRFDSIFALIEAGVKINSLDELEKSNFVLELKNHFKSLYKRSEKAFYSFTEESIINNWDDLLSILKLMGENGVPKKVFEVSFIYIEDKSERITLMEAIKRYCPSSELQEEMNALLFGIEKSYFSSILSNFN